MMNLKFTHFALKNDKVSITNANQLTAIAI